MTEREEQGTDQEDAKAGEKPVIGKGHEPQAGPSAANEPLSDSRRDAQLMADIQRLPRISLGALFMPAVWGPAHGQWITILFYPLWIFADSCFVNAVLHGGIALVLAVTVLVGTALVMVFFAKTVGVPAYLRVADRVPIDRYLKRERIWTFASIGIALVFLLLATWYNIGIRLPAGGL